MLSTAILTTKQCEKRFLCFCYFLSGQWIDSLTVRTNLGREKRFGTSDGGSDFKLDIPPGCEVVGFRGSYSSYLYQLAALYRVARKKQVS